MIDVTALEADTYKVVVNSSGTTTHRVRLTDDVRQRLAGPDVPAERLIEESFQFLLEREPNTAILAEFELPLIGRYFPDYEQEIRQRLG